MYQRVAAAALGLCALCSAQTPDLYDINVVRDFHLTFSQPNWWQLLLNNYAPEINIPADLRVDNVTYSNVGVRFRGNSSYFQLPPGSEKRSFNIETDWMVPGQDLYGYEHLNLNNGFHDPTFLREFLTYWVMRRHGPAPKCNFVRLHLNSVYWGIYINVQQPNKDMMREWFRSNDGNRYRGFPTSGSFSNGRTALTWLGSQVSAYLSAYQAKQGDGTDLMQMINVLNNTPVNQLQALLPAEFNVDQFYRYAAVMNATTQTDSYIGTGKDHFLYHDPVHGDFHMFPFDVNEAFAGSSNLDPWYQTTSSIKPAFSKTLQFPDWRERYKAHLRTVVEQSFNWQVLGPMVTRFHALLAPDVAADTKKIYTTQQFQDNLTLTVFASGVNVPGLIPMIQGRENFLRNHADLRAPRTALSNLQHSPSRPSPQQPVTITVQASSLAAAIKLWWRPTGAFRSATMYDDGQHGDGGPNDGVWGAILAPQAPGSIVDYYAEATTATNLATYEPHTAEYASARFLVDWPRGSSPIRINEFVAQNVTGIVDEANQHEDWLELYNDSDLGVNVSGMWVTDDLSRPKFQIPANQSIPPRGTLLIWCDEDGTQGPLHANFKLSSNGEALALFASDGQTLLDELEFGLQVADVATGRLRDGGTPWVSLPVPTPRLRNELAGCGSRVYAALDLRSHTAQLAVQGAVRINSSPTLAVTRGPASGAAGVLLATAPDHLDLAPISFPGEVLLLDALAMFGPLPFQLDAQGNGSTPLPIPNLPELVGARFYAQAAAASTALDLSNALELVICQ
jgi:hypothetical protein